MLRKLTQMPISRRLPAMAACLVLLPAAMGVFLYGSMLGLKMADTRDTLGYVAEQEAGRIGDWFEANKRQVVSAADQPMAAQAIRDLGAAVRRDGGGMARARIAYVAANPHPAGQRQQLVDAGDGSAYSAAHASVHATYRHMVDLFGLYDFFLFDTEGTLLYSVAKEADFGDNFATGPYASTGLARIYRAALEAEPGEVAFADFEPYAPSADAPAAFLAAPVVDASGTRVGVLAVQLSVEAIAGKITTTSMLGEKGDMYVLGADGRARTASRFEGRFDIFDTLPDLPHVAALKAGEYGDFDGTEGVSGVPSIVHTNAVGIDGADWSLVIELDRAEYLADLFAFRNRVAVFVGLGLIAGLGLGLWAARSITRPLGALVHSIEEVSGGNYAARIDVADRADEIGLLGRSLVAFRDRLADGKELEAKRARDQAAQESVTGKLANALAGLAGGDLTGTLDERFPYGFEPIRENFNRTVLTLRDLLGGIVANSTEIHTRAEEIALSSDDLSRRTENQAATLEETAAALDEITGSVRSAADGAVAAEEVVKRARADAEANGQVVDEAVSAMAEIKRSSEAISRIIGVIDDIAFQTNLLALNAGVEAARAGEAGRGFAVVASEVRSLAQSSADAAKEIKQLIGASSQQVDTGVELVNRAGAALGNIVSRVNNISELVTDIAIGAREQSVGLGEINAGVVQLDQVTQQNAAMVEEATATAATLKHQAEELRRQVARFHLGTNTATAAAMPARPAPVTARPAPRAAVGGANGWRDF